MPLLPGLKLAARLFEHPCADGDDQTGLFRDGDELQRHHQTANRVAPTDQSFKSSDERRLQIHDRLIEHLQLSAVQGMREIKLQRVAHPGCFEGSRQGKQARSVQVVLDDQKCARCFRQNPNPFLEAPT